MMRMRALIIVVASLLIAADTTKETALKQEMARLQGSWTIVLAELEGKPDPSRKGAQLTFTGNTFSRKSPSQSVKGTFKIDPTAKPKIMNVTYTEGPEKGESRYGIYALEGDVLKVCTVPGGIQRPTEFASKPGTSQLYLVFQRPKKVAAAPPPPPPSPFPDKNLEEGVRAALHEPKAPLTDANLMNLYFLEAPGKNIRNLKGLEKCKNLALIKLTKNQITDLAPLKELINVQSLDLASNTIADVKPLEGLNNLQYLELSHNQITKLEPLAGLTKLASLYLSDNKITDLGPLAKIARLSSLSVDHNQIRDISVLTKITQISNLDLNDNQVSDLGALTKQTELRLLMIERNKISDLTPLVAMSKADAQGQKRFAPFLHVYLNGNPLSELAKTKQIAELKSYGVRFP